MSPYGHEPLAEVCNDRNSDSKDEETDSDGLTPAVLAARFQRTVTVNSWCSYEGCKDEMQVGSQEFRCCSEVVHSSGKMVFDGSIERIKCITQHMLQSQTELFATSSSIIARQKWKNIPAARWGIQKRVIIYCLDDPLRLKNEELDRQSNCQLTKAS
ncbi:PREDICTED: uncharacterized protein LOC107350946 [Acropora digitifera]|uniref:uncharacterized protein LOC107350946 n=1 Tax=Acropora digitifera TaxID=70779 RepID=UPI00077AEEFA|nr:PREDICTED: uncharacterized protein LOC107350946 [Acropora digitifera]